jgi:ribonuclease HII
MKPSFKDLSLEEIRLIVHGLSRAELRRRAARRLARDPRAGARRLGAEILARLDREEAEAARLTAMERFEAEARAQGAAVIAGVDEVGRGPLAGPVFAAAVILPPGLRLVGLDDSKRLSAEQRETLCPLIREIALGVSIGRAEVEEIDTINIRQASFLAMRRALAGLSVAVDFVLVDGFAIPGLELRQRAIVKGDSRSASIAAASVIAKVARDAVMDDLDRLYPGYGLAENKGYCTTAHVEALRRLGPCPVHRRSFKWDMDAQGAGLHFQPRLFDIIEEGD